MKLLSNFMCCPFLNVERPDVTCVGLTQFIQIDIHSTVLKAVYQNSDVEGTDSWISC
jgi:hypothetical protein